MLGLLIETFVKMLMLMFINLIWYSKEQMEQKLLYAISAAAGFDLS